MAERQITQHFDGSPLLHETLKVEDNGPKTFEEGQDYTLDTKKSYKTIKIVTPEALEIIPQSDRKINLFPLTWGGSHVLFYAEDGELIKDLDVQFRHDVALLYPGHHGAHHSYYRCWDTGCDFVKEDKYEMPTTVHRQYNINLPPESPTAMR
jgi:hypothetical protein